MSYVSTSTYDDSDSQVLVSQLDMPLKRDPEQKSTILRLVSGGFVTTFDEYCVPGQRLQLTSLSSQPHILNALLNFQEGFFEEHCVPAAWCAEAHACTSRCTWSERVRVDKDRGRGS